MSEERDLDFACRVILKQQEGFSISECEHVEMLKLVDRGLIGTVGFRYCSTEEAREDARKIQLLDPSSAFRLRANRRPAR